MTKRLTLPLVFALLGAALMCLYGWASMQPAFVRWEPLGKPPTGATSNLAIGFVQTAAGEVYKYSHGPGCGENCWIKTDGPAPDLGPWAPVEHCGAMPAVDRFVDWKAFCRERPFQISLTVQAIDRTGAVFIWQHTVGGEWDPLIPWISSLIGFVAGLLIGAIVLSAILLWDLLKRARSPAQERPPE